MTTPMLPEGWTQQQGIQPWWSTRAQHLHLQVTTCEGFDPTWTVWDGHKCLAGGTAPDVLQAALAAEASARTMKEPPDEPTTQRHGPS